MSDHAPHRGEESRLHSFVGVATEGQTYRNLAYLLLAIPIGIAYQFGLMLGFFGGLILTFMLVGIPILVGTIVSSRYLAELERLLANRLLGTEIQRPGGGPIHGTEAGLLGSLKEIIISEVTWKGVGFLVLRSFLALIVLFLVILGGFVSLGLVLAPLSSSTVVLGWEIDTLAESLLAVPLGIVLGLAFLHVTNGVARVVGSLAVALLGDESAPDSEGERGSGDGNGNDLDSGAQTIP
ncbi:2-component system sensor kinase [Natrialba chahannaoensis JCM 10990]|uniref:2-component system sensor kinase n=1 Tax=Natrialba chahannaoensis JCM 10990 TaxID=1227492 RepID=M0A4L9_9EURY|nr:sensor domain-containing protein [Natrialba chahannaoensis]ELY93286.1 2-component system sensor kinase [Natrialba chahannaoensis JCM 10990]